LVYFSWLDIYQETNEMRTNKPEYRSAQAKTRNKSKAEVTLFVEEKYRQNLHRKPKERNQRMRI
jgi:hypothetical protein